MFLPSSKAWQRQLSRPTRPCKTSTRWRCIWAIWASARQPCRPRQRRAPAPTVSDRLWPPLSATSNNLRLPYEIEIMWLWTTSHKIQASLASWKRNCYKDRISAISSIPSNKHSSASSVCQKVPPTAPAKRSKCENSIRLKPPVKRCSPTDRVVYRIIWCFLIRLSAEIN